MIKNVPLDKLRENIKYQMFIDLNTVYFQLKQEQDLDKINTRIDHLHNIYTKTLELVNIIETVD